MLLPLRFLAACEPVNIMLAPRVHVTAAIGQTEIPTETPGALESPRLCVTGARTHTHTLPGGGERTTPGFNSNCHRGHVGGSRARGMRSNFSGQSRENDRIPPIARVHLSGKRDFRSGAPARRCQIGGRGRVGGGQALGSRVARGAPTIIPSRRGVCNGPERGRRGG